MEPGRTLLQYRLVEKIGEGGMGVVWRARDTTLDREVAIKLLPPEVAGDPDRRARFEREAKLLASLSHPGIAGVYGLHEDDGTHFFAIELVEGEELAEILARGPLPVDDALEVADQIALAVAAAHDTGVIHRDLKPANIKRTPEGRVKVLDFGLAKAVEPESADLTRSPTVTSAGSRAGVILGTAAYMSPEQAKGRAVDRRADVWGFGCVLYEMLAGRPAFAGDSVSEILAEVLKSEPDWSKLPRATPRAVRRLLARCLARNPDERLRDLGDARLELADAAVADDIREEAVAPAGPWKALAVVFGLAAVVAGALWWTQRGDGAAPGTPTLVSSMRLLADLPGSEEWPALSPDGRQLLYVADDGGDRDIFLLRVGGENAVNLTAQFGSHDSHPAWSPDGERIAFDSSRDGGGVFVMGATGESPLRVADEGFHPAWSPDGTRLVYSDEDVVDPYARSLNSELTIVELATGRRTVVPAEGDAVQGQWSPDGRLLAYWTSDRGQRDIRTILTDGSAPYVPVTDDPPTDWAPVWSPDGSWLYFVSDRGGSPDLWRVPIDSRTGAPDGPLEAVTTGVARVVAASLAADGRQTAVSIRRESSLVERVPFDPVRERPAGEPELVLASSNGATQIRLSGDERWLAYRSTAPQDDLFTIRVDGSGRRRLTDDAARDRGPSWSPGDEWLVFYSNRSGKYENWMIRHDGTGLRRVTDRPAGDVNDIAWSHGGRRVAAILLGEGTGFYDVDPEWLDAATRIEPVPVEVAIEGFYAWSWSPDDRRLYGTVLGDGEFYSAIADVATGEVVPLKRPDGTLYLQRGRTAAWLDAERLLLWDVDRAGAVVVDVASGDVRPVPGLVGSGELEIADGGRTLYLVRNLVDTEVWLLELGGAR